MSFVPSPNPSNDPAKAATDMLAQAFARDGFVPPPAVTKFLEEMDGQMRELEAPVPTQQGNMPEVPTLEKYQKEQAKKDLTLKTVRNIEIATYMLANKDLSIKEIADKFGVTPATITRIIGTDGFQYVLAEEAKKLAITYKGMRADFDAKLQVGAALVLDRLIERIPGSNDTDQLLKILSQFTEIMGLGAKQQSAPATQVNVFGVTGDHLKFATNQRPPVPATYDSTATRSDDAPATLSISG